MITIFCGLVLVIGAVFHIAWIAKRAAAKGRNPLAWVAIGIALAVAGVDIGISLFNRADGLSSDALTLLYVTSPITLAIGPLLLVVLVLMALPVTVADGHRFPVFHARDGAGTLVIDDDSVVLELAERSERIPRAELTATADQESLRLAWPGHELLLIPAGKVATRDGRMRQAEAIAARLKR